MQRHEMIAAMGVEVVIEAVDGHRREKRFRAAAVVEAQ